MRRVGARQVRHVRKVADAERLIAEKLPDLVERMIDLAIGVSIQDEDRKGERRVYQKPPDRQAAEYLIDILLKRVEKRASEPGPAVKIIEVMKSS